MHHIHPMFAALCADSDCARAGFDHIDPLSSPEHLNVPPASVCGCDGCSLEPLWRQYEPSDRRFPLYLCAHHRSYMLVRDPAAVLLYGWVGIFPDERFRRL